MHFYAKSDAGENVSAKFAEKRVNYQCLECKGIVRLREGPCRKPHFYHLQENSFCKQAAKSLPHLQLQLFFLETLPDGEVSLEFPFESVQRIADVCWHMQKLIFEIQCSPITRVEVEARNRDYASVGYQVIWIFHDKRFNQWKVSAAERALRDLPYYFSDMSADGKGGIYDQWCWIQKGIRVEKLKPLFIDVTKPIREEGAVVSFVGDFKSLKGMKNDAKAFYYLEQAKDREEIFCQMCEEKVSFKIWAQGLFWKGLEVFEDYYRQLLRKYCR